MTALWNLIFFLIAIGILVTVHEAGHFYMARFCGVFCERFSIGFGKVIWRFKDKKGTEYAVSAIPLGGYVKMKGENAQGDNARDSYAAQPVGKRALIIAAGPLCNIILAFLLYIIVALNGTIDIKAVAAGVRDGSLAQQALMQPLDEVTSVNGRRVESWSDAVMEMIENLGSKVAVEVTGFEPILASDVENAHLPLSTVGEYAVNPNAGTHRTLSLDLTNVSLGPREDLLELIGIRPLLGISTNIITLVQEGSPAYRAGLMKGDAVLSINGIETPNWIKLQEAASQSFGELELIVRRDGREYKTFVTPDRRCDENTGQCRSVMGIGTEYYPLENLTVTREYGPLEAVGKAAADTANMSMLIVRSTVMLLNGTISAENISGPISIARGAGQSASVGLIFFISFLAAVSVNLGILNLLPIPVLDGGQLIFLAYEAISGKQPSAKVQTVLTALGLGFLVTLSLFAIFNDIRAL